MRTQVIGLSFSVTEAMRQFAESRLALAVSPARGNVSEARVEFLDVNGRRGGEDKCCRVALAGPGLGLVKVQAVARDLYDAIDRACGKAREALRRHKTRREAARRRRRMREQVRTE